MTNCYENIVFFSSRALFLSSFRRTLSICFFSVYLTNTFLMAKSARKKFEKINRMCTLPSAIILVFFVMKYNNNARIKLYIAMFYNASQSQKERQQTRKQSRLLTVREASRNPVISKMEPSVGGQPQLPKEKFITGVLLGIYSILWLL